MDDNHQPIDKSELLINLTSRFNKEELKTLAFDVGVDWDELEGRPKHRRRTNSSPTWIGAAAWRNW